MRCLIYIPIWYFQWKRPIEMKWLKKISLVIWCNFNLNLWYNKDQIWADCITFSTFIFAATDTTTSAISKVLSILAEHQDIQSQVREEVTTARHTYGDLDYDTLQSLPLLDAVCRETLRLYAPVPNTMRVWVTIAPFYLVLSFSPSLIATVVLTQSRQGHSPPSSLANKVCWWKIRDKGNISTKRDGYRHLYHERK